MVEGGLDCQLDVAHRDAFGVGLRCLLTAGLLESMLASHQSLLETNWL